MIDQSTQLDTFLQGEAQAIKRLLKHTAQSVLEIGTRLLRVKEALIPEDFEPWVSDELGIDEKTARNFMNVATRFADGNFPQVEVSALYLLAAPSTPDELIQAVDNGTLSPDLASIKAARREYRAGSAGSAGGGSASQTLATKALVKQVIGLVQNSKLYESGAIDQEEVTRIVASVKNGWPFSTDKRKKTLTALELLGQALTDAASTQKR